MATVEPGEEVTFEIRDSRDRLIGARLGSRRPGRPPVDRPSAHRPGRGARRRARRCPRARGARPTRPTTSPGPRSFPGPASWETCSNAPSSHGGSWWTAWPARNSSLAWQCPPACTPAHRRGAVAGAVRAAPRHREAAIGAPNPPTPEHAWPPEAADGLRTYPPRENGGNMDIRDLGPGARLWLPIHLAGRTALGRRPPLRPGRRRGVHLGDRDRRRGDRSGSACGGGPTPAGAPASRATRPRLGPLAPCSPPPASRSPTTAARATST